jgi:hypothetical protein
MSTSSSMVHQQQWEMYGDRDSDDRRSRSGSPPSPAGSLHVPRIRDNLPENDYTRAWVDNTTAFGDALIEGAENELETLSDSDSDEAEVKMLSDNYQDKMSTDSGEKQEAIMGEQETDDAAINDPDSIKTWPQVNMDYGEIYAFNGRSGSSRQLDTSEDSREHKPTWTDREDELFVILVQDFGPNWSRIRDHLPRFSFDDVRYDPVATQSTITDLNLATRLLCLSEGSTARGPN